MKMDYFVHKSSYIDQDVQIGKGTKIWHFCHIQQGVSIGENCSFGQNVNIASHVHIGNGVKVQNNVSIYEGVELEDFVFCGPSMVFTNDLTPRAKYPKGRAGYRNTVVRTGASIGANATIVCGHELGAWCMIAAGAVVTEYVPAYALMAGVPAKQIGWVCECGQVLTTRTDFSEYHSFKYPNSKNLNCPICGRKYQEIENGVLVERKHQETKNRIFIERNHQKIEDGALVERKQDN